MEFDLFDIDNVNEISIGSWGPPGMSASDFIMEFEDEVYLFLQHRKDGTWTTVPGGKDLEYAMGGSAKLEKQLEELSERGGVDMWAMLNAGEYSECPECSEEALKELASLLLPKKKPRVEIRDGRPYIGDTGGNEYFLGGVIDVDTNKIESMVDWWFPDDCGWIPKSLYRNC